MGVDTWNSSPPTLNINTQPSILGESLVLVGCEASTSVMEVMQCVDTEVTCTHDMDTRHGHIHAPTQADPESW